MESGLKDVQEVMEPRLQPHCLRCPLGNTLSVGLDNWIYWGLHSLLPFVILNERKATQAVHALAAANELLKKKYVQKFL